MHEEDMFVNLMRSSCLIMQGPFLRELSVNSCFTNYSVHKCIFIDFILMCACYVSVILPEVPSEIFLQQNMYKVSLFIRSSASKPPGSRFDHKVDLKKDISPVADGLV